MNGPVQQFANLAREYVTWAEDSTLGADAEAGVCLSLLARLYAAALELPGSDGDTVQDVPEVPRADIERVFRRFGNMPFQYYFELFEPVTWEPEEPVAGDLSDDLTDIYSGLRAGLEAYDAGAVAGALFWWRHSFGFHWGRHLTSALRALHCFETRG